jgi:phosphorylcholine metabolism protein LicD
MNEYQSQNIIINDDLQLEIHHNPFLRGKSFLLRMFGYDGMTSHLMTKEDLLNLSEQIADFVFDKSKEVEYTDNYTGLVRLWHHRRNECLDKIEELEKRLQSYEQDNNNR